MSDDLVEMHIADIGTWMVDAQTVRIIGEDRIESPDTARIGAVARHYMREAIRRDTAMLGSASLYERAADAALRRYADMYAAMPARAVLLDDNEEILGRQHTAGAEIA